MIVAFIQKYGAASQKELDGLIIEKLSRALTDKQKINKVGNLISALRIEGKVKNNGSDKKSSWVLSKIF